MYDLPLEVSLHGREQRTVPPPQCIHGHDIGVDGWLINTQGQRVCPMCRLESSRRYELHRPRC